MKLNIPALWRMFHKDGTLRRRATALLLLTFGLLSLPLSAQTVGTIGGRGYSGSPIDGNTLHQALFNQPSGLALNPAGSYLFVADYGNNVVRFITAPGNTATSTTSTLTNTSAASVTSGINHPVSVVANSTTNLFVLNKGSGTDGTVLQFSVANIRFPSFVVTNASRLTNATAMANDNFNNLYVTVRGNTVLRITPPSTVAVIGVITNAGVSLQGIAVMDDGKIALSDAGKNGIWLMDPTAVNPSNNVTMLAGFNGAGDNPDDPSGIYWPVPAEYAIFNHPANISKAGNGFLVIADKDNHRVKILDTILEEVTFLYGDNPSLWNPTTPGWLDGSSGTLAGFAESRLPYGLLVASDGSVFASEDYYHVLRHITDTGLTPPPLPPPPPPAAPNNLTITAKYVTLNNGQVNLTWTSVATATNYIVKRSQSSGSESPLASTGGTSYSDNSVINGNTYYYVVSAVNTGGEGPNSAEVSLTVPLPPVPDPQIGYVEFPPPLFASVFHAVSAAGVTFNNDKPMVIVGTTGSHTYYNYSNTPSATNLPDPTAASFEAGAGYVDGLYAVPSGSIVAQILPNVSIKAIGMQAGHSNSAVVSALFQFVAANPVINEIGNGAGGFNISDITIGAHLYYTLDGSDPSPTNYASNGDLGVAPSSNQWLNVNFPITSNTWFKVRAYKEPNYQPSAIVSNLFTVAGTHYTTITFGKAFGEPHSAFVARPGQYFYAPVTLQLLPGFGKMYSLQFNVAVTNGYTNIFNGGAIPPVLNGDGIDFRSMLMTQVDPAEGLYFPPSDGQWYLPIPNLTSYILLGTTNLTSTVFINTNNNLIGVGWLYRTGFKYKEITTNIPPIVFLDFDTVRQDLITYSIAHDTLLGKAGGTVLAGAYSFRVPASANIGDQYFIQLGSPSATADGVGASGADITIAPPGLSQAVTVGSPAYVVGDAAPFHWFNAGDFGNTNLDNSDVMQVYQSAIELVNMPPLNSDLYLAMDSSGRFGVWDSVNNYYTDPGPGANLNVVQQQAMWDGNDLAINTNAFGDGSLDINDLYVTFRRSLDPSLTWYKRYWTNNQFVAVTTPNLAYNSNSPHLAISQAAVTPQAAGSHDYRQSTINFTAGDAIASANQTIQIPISAQIFGDYPLRVLGLSLTVVPLDGSPAITTPINFAPAAGLGSPTIASTKGAANYSAAWLNSSISGLTGNTLIGTLTVTLPANATSTSAYAVHFARVSGSPNGLAVFPEHAFTGLISLSNRTNSSYGDGIPDAWRLRWFGTTNNELSRSNSCPSADGINCWMKYIAGVDPKTANNFPSVNPQTPATPGFNTTIRWPTVSGKQYVIERATDLFIGDWTIMKTNNGTGIDMTFDDLTKGTHFYRVRILP